PTVGARLSGASLPDGLDIAKARASIRKGHKIRIRYRNEQGDESERVIWPTMIGYAETVRLLAAWCELRQNFRHFRTDRVSAAEFLDERIGCRPGELRNRWKRHMEAQGLRLP
ncbi:MAG: WYL domain-containing protein, partial [Mesorhizobium sp.]